MSKPKIHLCFIGFGIGTRTLTEEIILLTQSLCADHQLVLIDSEPDETCENVIRFVYEERNSAARLDFLLKAKEEYFQNCLGDSEYQSEKPAISHPGFLGKDYPVREEEFQFRERYHFWVNRNKGPPRGPFLFLNNLILNFKLF